LADPTQRPLLLVPSVGQFEALMSRLGISNRATVVVYDTDGGLWCARLWWALRYYGHQDVKLLHGGLPKWQSEGRPMEKEVTRPTASTFRAQVHPELRATRKDIEAAMGNTHAIILDTLSANQHAGNRPDMPRWPAGHIPSAKSVPAPANLDPTNHLLLPPEKLAALYQQAGVTPDKAIITYCGGGYYGAFSAFVLYQLGYENVRLYDGSWIEWVSSGGKIEVSFRESPSAESHTTEPPLP
jgi:thiosulfate/3-mercaptopyruvate sulfurtransferase